MALLGAGAALIMLLPILGVAMMVSAAVGLAIVLEEDFVEGGCAPAGPERRSSGRRRVRACRPSGPRFGRLRAGRTVALGRMPAGGRTR